MGGALERTCFGVNLGDVELVIGTTRPVAPGFSAFFPRNIGTGRAKDQSIAVESRTKIRRGGVHPFVFDGIEGLLVDGFLGIITHVDAPLGICGVARLPFFEPGACAVVVACLHEGLSISAVHIGFHTGLLNCFFVPGERLVYLVQLHFAISYACHGISVCGICFQYRFKRLFGNVVGVKIILFIAPQELIARYGLSGQTKGKAQQNGKK